MLECLLVCYWYNMATSRLRGLQKFLFRPSTFCFSSFRPIHTGIMNLGNLEKEFQAASERSKILKQDPGNEHKLKLYALFKQVGFVDSRCLSFYYLYKMELLARFTVEYARKKLEFIVTLLLLLGHGRRRRSKGRSKTGDTLYPLSVTL